VPLNQNTYRQLVSSSGGGDIISKIPEKLVPLWCDDYYQANPSAELVEVNLDDSPACFSYLFDINLQRNIVAWGIPTYASHQRDASRMAGHPLSAGSQYHRGHLMAHSIGGGTDINLVPQLGKLNIGQFRRIERMVRQLAKENVRCLYFVRTIYTNNSQIPSKFEQCVIQSAGAITYDLQSNS
jgi:hypothetical protein